MVVVIDLPRTEGAGPASNATDRAGREGHKAREDHPCLINGDRHANDLWQRAGSLLVCSPSTATVWDGYDDDPPCGVYLYTLNSVPRQTSTNPGPGELVRAAQITSGPLAWSGTVQGKSSL